MNPLVLCENTLKNLEGRLAETIGNGMKPTLALVFSSVQHDLQRLISLFSCHGIQVFGATSSGEIAGDEMYEGAIAVMLLDLDESAFRLKMFDGTENAPYQAGGRIACWTAEQFNNPGLIIMAAGLQTDGEKIVRGIAAESSRPLPLFGCLAGDDLRLRETFVFDSAKVINNGAIALAFDGEKVELKGVAVSGWKGVGVRKTVTRAEGNRVYTIDGEPAMDVYRKYLDLSRDDDIQLAVQYPIQLERDDGTFVLRAMTRIHDDHSVTYAGTVPQGARVRFSLPIGTETIDHTVEQLRAFHERVPNADAVIVFNCKSRHVALGLLVEEEIAPLPELWNAPVIGFFTYGEIGAVPEGCCDFHNHTISLILLRFITPADEK